ncbi:MAG TPA: GvpL/GvpF family gas vesicle protein [Myxococcales bacterium]|nr:GvpL/GvpF family gas vesicle protein [Myxococcales bacterium]
MKLYLYAFTDRPTAGAHGLWGEPLLGVPVGRFFAACGPTADAPAVTATALRGHDAAIRSLAGSCQSVLPVRFGQLVEGERALREAVQPLASEIEGALARVAGCEQMTVRLFGEEASSAPAASGTEHLLRLRERTARRAAALAPLRQTVAHLCVDERVEAGTGRLLLTVSHLVRRGRSRDYRAALEAAVPPAGITVSGPWAPYAFGPEVGL